VVTGKKANQQKLQKQIEKLQGHIQLDQQLIQDLKSSIVRYHSSFNRSNDGIFIHDLDGRIMDVNKKALKLLGYKKSDILQLKIADLHLPEAREKSAEALEKIRETGSIEFEIDFLKKSGHTFTAEVSASIFSIGQQKVVQGMVRDISERKKMEEALKASQRQLSSIVRSVPDIIYRLDKDSQIIFISDSIRDYGYQPDELLGKNIFELIHPEDREKAKYRVNERRTGERRTRSFEIRLQAKNRKYIPFDVHSQGLYDEPVFLLEAEGLYSTEQPQANAFLGSQGVARDITERKITESIFKESEEKFRSIVENSHAGIVIVDEAFRLIYANDQFVKIFGYAKDEFLNKDFRILLEGTSKDLLIDHYLRRQRGEQIPLKYDALLKRKNGEECFVEVISKVTITSLGQKQTIVQFLDITERKKWEKALSESENKFRQLFQNANDSIYLWELEEDGKIGKCLEVNDKGCEILGYQRDELLLMNARDIAVRKNGLQLPLIIKQIQKKGNSAFEMAYQTKDDRQIPVEINAHIFKLNGKKVVLSIARDITERKLAEEALRKKSDQQEQLLKIASNLTESLNLTEVLTRIGHGAKKMLQAASCTIYLLEPNGKTLRPVVALDPNYEKEILSTPITVDDSFTGQSVKAKRGLIFNNAGQIESGHQIPGTPEEEDENIIVAPFIADEKILGALCLNRYDDIFTEEDLALTETFAIYAATALKNSKAHSDLQREIQERMQVEKALIDSEEKFRNLAEQSPNMIFIIENNKIIYANEKCTEIMGYSRDELYDPGFDFIKLIAKESIKLVKENFKKHLHNPDIPPFEYTLLTKSGKRIEVIITTKLIKYQGEEVILGIITDITERKSTELALRKSEEKYRRFFEEDLTGDYISTKDGQLLSCNTAFLKIFGFKSKEEALQTNVIQLYLKEENRKAFIELLCKKKKLEYHEMELKRFDGKPVYLIANMTGRFDNEGKLQEIQGYLFDNTERKVLEQQFRQAQKMEAVGRLAGGVAHDFNNLLTIITGYSDLILHRLPKIDPTIRDIKQIKQASEKASRLTNQLLAFSRRQVLQPKLVNLNSIVMDNNKMLRRLIGEDIELIHVLDPNLGVIKADPGQIEQVIMNLAVNARDAMPTGGKLTIETGNVLLERDYMHKHIAVQPAGNYVTLSITDNGNGMDEETLAHIFEPFFTTKEYGKGTGLGLSTVYGIVKQSEGFIWVNSDAGSGSTFKIYFPRVWEQLPETTPIHKSSKSLSGQETILLVEDEEMVRELAVRILTEKGYQVLEASRGETALEISKNSKQPIDLMITDIVMPGISGKKLAYEIKKERPDLKVLYISGYTDEIISQQGYIEQQVDFLQKPFLPDKFLLQVREILDR
jgi:two-component system cell cycle sensor histidine kinase/response regulator CckA